MTLELVPWRGSTVPLLGGRDEISRYTTQDYINWITQNHMYTGQPPIQTTYGSRPAEPISYSFQGFVEGMLYADGPVAAAEAYRLRVFGQAPLLYQETFDGRPGDVFDDKNLDRLRAPWPGATLSDLMKRSLIYGDFAGNAFVVDIDDELVLVRPDWVEIVLEQRKFRGQVLGYKQVGIMYYEGGLRTGEGVPFLPGEYAHFVPGLPDPLASYRGMSWLTPILREVQADKSASAHKLAFFENAASPNLAVQLPKEVTPDQFNAFVEAMDAKHKGAANAYKTLYTGGGADVTVIGANMQQMDFSSVQGKGETRLANAAGVPPVLLSFSEGMQGSSLNAGNYTAAKRNFVDTTMRDLWSNFCGSIAQMDYFQPPMPKTRLWYDGRDIPFLHEDAKDLADIQSTRASTINSYITAGWKPETAVAAVNQDDVTLLQHTGAYSVQLQPPGAQDTDGDGQADDFAAPPELQNFDFGSLREGVGNTGTDQPAEAQRARWDLRYGKGNKGGGKFRSLKDAVVPILKDWASGKGERDPLEQFQPRQLRTMAKQMADEASKAGEHRRASSLTLGPRASKAELKKALYEDAMFENTGTRPDFANPASKTRISDAKAAAESRPRQPSMREMGFDDALDNGDFDAAMDLAIADFRERRGRDMTPDELDRLERNIDAAIGRREKKKPPQPQQPEPTPGSERMPQVVDPQTGQVSTKQVDLYERSANAGDRLGALQARVDDYRAQNGRSPDPDEYRQIQQEVDADLTSRQNASPSTGDIAPADSAQVAKIASAFHEDWRKTRLQPDGTYEPRVKKTKDQAWIDARGTDDVDIANTSYDDLPEDWQAENKAAAEVVEGILRKHGGTVDLNDEATRQEVGEEIHQAWLDRNKWAAGGELDVPFADLPADEQAKDIDQLKVAMGVSEIAEPSGPGGRNAQTDAEKAYERAFAANDEFMALQARVDGYREQYGTNPDPDEVQSMREQITRDFERRRRNRDSGGPAFARADFGAMRDWLWLAGEDAIERAIEEMFDDLPDLGEIERRYDIRVDKGFQGGGRFRKLSDQMVALLTDWSKGEGPDDPLDEFERDQLLRVVGELRKKATAAGDSDGVARLTPRRNASKAELKLALYDDAVANVRGARQRDSGVRAPEPPVKAPRARKAVAPKATAATPDISSLRQLGDKEAIRDQLDLLTLDKIKPLLASEGLPRTGKKRDLVDRLTEHLSGGGVPGDGGAPEPPAKRILPSEQERIDWAKWRDSQEGKQAAARLDAAQQRAADAKGMTLQQWRDDQLAQKPTTRAKRDLLRKWGLTQEQIDELVPLKRSGASAPRAAKAAPDLMGANGLSSVPAVREVQIENRIRAAYRDALAAGDRGYNGRPAQDRSVPGVRLSAVRDRIGADIPRAEVDDALRRLAADQGVHIGIDENQQTLTEADRAAIVRVGMRDATMISIEKGDARSPRPLPSGGGPDTPGGDLNPTDLALLRNASDGTTKNLGSSQGGRDRNEQIDRLVAAGFLRAEGGPADPTGANGLSTDPAVRRVQLDNRVREAYRGLRNPGEWVGLADLREHPALRDLSRAEQDEALKGITRFGDNYDVTGQTSIRLIPVANSKALSEREWAARLVVGDTPTNAVLFGDPTPRAVPGSAGDRYVLTDKGRQATGGRLPFTERSEGLDPEDIDRAGFNPNQPRGFHGRWSRFRRWHSSLDGLGDLAAAVESGEEARMNLKGGLNAEIHYVEHRNGGESIEKVPLDADAVFGHGAPSAKQQADAEQLASQLGRSIGAPVPRVLRTAEDKVNMDFVEGRPWAQHRAKALARGATNADLEAELDGLVNGRDGTRLGAFDILTGNWDRNNPDNWFVDEGRPVGIDHAYAWAEILPGSVNDISEYEGESPFAKAFIRETGDGFTWADNPLTPGDIDFLREQLAAVEDDFNLLGRHDWWAFAKARLEAIAPHAKGTDPIFT